MRRSRPVTDGVMLLPQYLVVSQIRKLECFCHKSLRCTCSLIKIVLEGLGLLILSQGAWGASPTANDIPMHSENPNPPHRQGFWLLRPEHTTPLKIYMTGANFKARMLSTERGSRQIGALAISPVFRSVNSSWVRCYWGMLSTTLRHCSITPGAIVPNTRSCIRENHARPGMFPHIYIRFPACDMW